jgi:hypothetical protein
VLFPSNIVLGFLGFVLAIVAAVLLFVGISKLKAHLIIPTIVLLVGLTIFGQICPNLSGN